jgi:hypothetical protein
VRLSRPDAPRDLRGVEPVAASIVLECLAAGLGFASHLVEESRRTEAAVRVARVEEPLDISAVPLETRALMDDLLVPAEP